MSVDLPRPPSRTASPVDPEVVSLVTGIIGNIETLVAQQMRLAQREVAAGIKSRSAAGAVVVSGLAVGMLATSAMSAAAAHGLHGWLSSGVTDPAAWSLGACYAWSERCSVCWVRVWWAWGCGSSARSPRGADWPKTSFRSRRRGRKHRSDPQSDGSDARGPV